MSLLDYWRRDVGHIQVYRYHLEKVGHSLLIGAVFTACGIPSLFAVMLGVVSYLVIGKALVKSKPSLDWIADLHIGALALVAERFLTHGEWAFTLLYLWIVGYGYMVYHRRWASP